jgi:glycosyltransferase involved in cell wall biosynthesis
MAGKRVSVVIPTYNRKETLRSAINSSLAQTLAPEVIVLDDGSTDGTQEMMQGEFPEIRYERFNGPNGPSFLRTKGAGMASGEIMFPIDDDAVFESSRTIEQTVAEFDHPRIAAVGIPFVNVKTGPEVIQRAPDTKERYVVAAYIGACHALRRDLFLQVGGYRKELFYMGEEGDVCLRLLNRGYVTRLGNADPMKHFESPKRVHRRADLYGRRNDILFGWQNVPTGKLPAYWMRATAGGVQHGLRVGRPLRMMQGLLWGYGSTLTHLGSRAPVKREILELFLRMKRQGAMALREIETQLPAVEAAGSST